MNVQLVFSVQESGVRGSVREGGTAGGKLVAVCEMVLILYFTLDREKWGGWSV